MNVCSLNSSYVTQMYTCKAMSQVNSLKKNWYLLKTLWKKGTQIHSQEKVPDHLSPLPTEMLGLGETEQWNVPSASSEGPDLWKWRWQVLWKLLAAEKSLVRRYLTDFVDIQWKENKIRKFSIISQILFISGVLLL